MIDSSKIRIIGFDADDTLWHNESIFRDAEDRIAALLAEYDVPHVLQKEMYGIEMQNLPSYGYGIKGFTLSMIELASRVSGGRVSATLIDQILEIGKEMIAHPVEVLPSVEETLARLSEADWRLVVVTKGDLLDQERKLRRSGLSEYFHHVEILSDKKPENYMHVLNRLDMSPQHFMMIGNSLKSDVLPVIELGGQAVHIPYHTTWAHEMAETEAHHQYLELAEFSALLEVLGL